MSAAAPGARSYKFLKGVLMRVLVTGGAGFLGSHLCEQLVNEGHYVICLDNLETSTLKNIERLGAGNFRFVNADITKKIKKEYQIGEIDWLFHLASPASPIDYLRLPLQTLQVGSYGTNNALEYAKENRAKFLLASTSEVYGDPQEHPQSENYWGHVNPIGPRGVYDEAKRYAEALTMAYHRYQGVDTRIIRIFNTYGPRMRPNDGRAIPTFIRQALKNQPITVFGDGSQTRSFCYVDDLIRGIINVMQTDYSEYPMNMPINLGNPAEFTLIQLAQKIIDLTDSKSMIVFEELPEDDPKIRKPDITIAKKHVGFRIETSLDEGLQKTLSYS